jgi:Lar family restriction alleviation protein
MPGIRRCPFCGSRKINIECFDRDVYMAICDNCGAGTGIRKTDTEAREAWNIRASMKEEALQITGEISLSCPKCGTKIQGNIKSKYK